jgi:uncharacterized FAD-dependent dehydrogenase
MQNNSNNQSQGWMNQQQQNTGGNWLQNNNTQPQNSWMANNNNQMQSNQMGQMGQGTFQSNNQMNQPWLQGSSMNFSQTSTMQAPQNINPSLMQPRK